MKKLITSILLVSMLCMTAIQVSADEAEPVDYSNYEWPEVTWRIAHATAVDNPCDKGTVAFANYIMEKTGGKITVENYPAGQLGTDIAQVEACLLGDLEFTSGSSFALHQNSGVDGVMMWDIPWFYSPWRAEAGMDLLAIKEDPAFNEIFVNQLGEKGIKYLNISNFGSYVVIANKPIKTAEDMKGLKVRAAENEMLVQALTEWGSQPVVINMFELYTALEQGTCDAAYAPDTVVYQFGLQDAVDYISYLEGGVIPCYLSCSMEFWDSLDPELQQLVTEAAQAYCDASFECEEDYVYEMFDADDAAGCEIVRLTNEEKEAFKEATSDTWASWRDRIGADLFDASQEYTKSILEGKNIEIPER